MMHDGYHQRTVASTNQTIANIRRQTKKMIVTVKRWNAANIIRYLLDQNIKFSVENYTATDIKLKLQETISHEHLTEVYYRNSDHAQYDRLATDHGVIPW